MAFALTLVQIDEALKQTGCAICRLTASAVRKSAEGFLYENTLDPQVREPILKSRGFCAEHTRLLAAIELSTDGSALGLNYVYEQLSRIVAEELTQPAMIKRPSLLRKRTESFPPCPFCELADESARNYLNALFEELEKETSPTRATYAQSNGICYSHLRGGLEEFGGSFPHAAAFLVEGTKDRLLTGSTRMKEYIRKHNWYYRDEKISPEEATAWRTALAFFTGLPEEKFDHKFEK